MSSNGRTPAPTKNKSARRRVDRKRAYIICTILAAIFVIAMAVVLMSMSDNRVYNDYMNQAQTLYYQKDYDGALSALRKAAAVEKTDECLLLMATCYEQQGNYAKALEVLRSMDIRDSTVAGRIETIENARKSLNAADLVTVAGKQYRVGTTKLVLDNMGLGDEVLDEVLQLYGLDSLSLAGNELTDISALSALGGLVTLNLSANRIRDLTPLASLPALRTLYLDANPVEDLTPLYAVTTLTSLSIKNIPVSESQLSALSKALPNCAIHSEQAQEEQQEISFGGVTFPSDITDLDLSEMGIRDISALANCQYLTRLNLTGNEVSDLSPLMNLPYLQYLDVSYNRVNDLRPLMGVDSLSFLNAAGNSISSTSPLTMMNGLSSLYLDSNPIRDFSGLRRVVTLNSLGLSGTGLTNDDLLYLRSLSSLVDLNIEDNPELTGEAVDDLRSYLRACHIRHDALGYDIDFDGFIVKSDSEALNMPRLGIRDISAVMKLNNLRSLDLSSNEISNLYPLELADCRFQITNLVLRDNDISDLTPLASVMNLETLDLSYNEATTVLPLLNLSSLRTLILTGNPMSLEEVELIRSTLPNCDVIF
ncbi:MAG: leucine-rich repeat domain-containing protein [Oscillospiraceae bacterium]|nr:leucine-rich repeat domain-containing protein [Oscillospiraceae bacterium]